MRNEDLLREILDTQKQQSAILGDLLVEQKNNNIEYQEYLEGQNKSNDEYRESLEKSWEQSTRRDAERLEEHDTYMRGAAVTRIANYARVLSSVCIAGLICYMVFFGVNIN